MKKLELHLTASGNGRAVEIEPQRVLANNVTFKGEHGRSHLWVILTLYGPAGAVWANNIQEALDILVDSDLAGAILIDPKEYNRLPEKEQEQYASLGNSGEPCDLSNVAVEPVVFNPERDWRLMCKFAEARGAGHDNLDF
jgi:hypothetical protein